MARIIGGLTTSHIPSIGAAVPKEAQLRNDPYWKEFFGGYPPARAWLQKQKPDVAVVIYNDHGLNFFLNNMPTFAIGAAPQYRYADEGWGIPDIPPFQGDPELSWHIINSVVDDEFDVASCQEMFVDHGFTVPMSLFWPGNSYSGVKTVPICINTVQHPLPSPARCYKFGQAIGRAIESYDKNLKVVMLGTGGMSHQLDGERAGFINKEFDLMCMEKIVNDPQALAKFSIHDLVRLAGAQGAEIILWLTMRGALRGKVTKVHSNYHIAISNTATGLLVLENGIEEGSGKSTFWL
jgi:protocatechuate 4,5-dioxygenase, beta chain